MFTNLIGPNLSGPIIDKPKRLLFALALEDNIMIQLLNDHPTNLFNDINKMLNNFLVSTPFCIIFKETYCSCKNGVSNMLAKTSTSNFIATNYLN